MKRFFLTWPPQTVFQTVSEKSGLAAIVREIFQTVSGKFLQDPTGLVLGPNPKGIPSRSPGLAPRAYPGKAVGRSLNPNGVATRMPPAARRPTGRNPVGVGIHWRLLSRVAPKAFGATLGFGPQSLWDWQIGRVPDVQAAPNVQARPARAGKRYRKNATNAGIADADCI